MPKVTITFDLPEEQGEYDISNSAMKFYCSLIDIGSFLREWEKWEYPKEIKTADDMLEKIRENFYEKLQDNGINLDNYN